MSSAETGEETNQWDIQIDYAGLTE